MGLLKNKFDKQGYVVLENFITKTQVLEVETAVNEFIKFKVPNMPNNHVFYEDKNNEETLKQLQHLDWYLPFFKNLFESNFIVSLAEELLGDAVVAKNMQWFNKPAQIGKATPPHQDGYYFMLEPNEALTMWLAIDSVDESNGCIRYQPQSHRRGMRPHDNSGVLGFSQGIRDYNEQDKLQETAIVANPGDLLVHHSKTIHRADPNKSNRSRRGLGFIFYSANAKENKAKHDLYQLKLRKELSKTNKI